MRLIDADALEKILEKIPAADIKNMGGQAYVLVKLSQVFNVIDNQPTIEPDERMLHESCTDCPLYDKDRHSCPRFNKVIPEVLREVQTEQRWIPCKEKMPKELTRVLVCTDRGFVCIAYLKVNHKEKDRPWLIYGADPDVRGNIIKWMPLPGPYAVMRGGEDDLLEG